MKTFADVDEAQALRLAAALEQGSSHPLARAILDKAGDYAAAAGQRFPHIARAGRER